ncbi:GIY-YIG nuclease family protein [Priestia megaterium]|uniref:GIY-YIG nuclease family protein n=1 Tax=Priestia megaterium TaxID=1404 RepID=UPI0031FC99BC
MSCCKPHGIENCDPVKVCEYEKEDGDERENSIMLSAELGVKDIHQYDLLRGFEDFKNDGFFNEEDPAFDVIAAVYVFYDHTKEVPLYVGESTRINGRLFEDHLKGHTTSIAHNLFLHFRHVKIYHLSEFDVAHRHLLEQMIIFKEKPLYNTWIMKMFSEQQFLSVLKTLKTRENWPDATTSELAALLKN